MYHLSKPEILGLALFAMCVVCIIAAFVLICLYGSKGTFP